MRNTGMKNFFLWAVALLTFNGFAVCANALPLALTPSTPVTLSSGSGFVSGTVDRGHQIFDFAGNAGDRLTLAVNVTEVYTGVVFTNNDTRLFLFNELGMLETWNDNFNGSLESQIVDYLLLTSGNYYAAITTGANRPFIGADGVITGWADNGRGSVGFDLTVEVAAPPTVNPVPEPATMLLFGTGLVGITGHRLRKRR